MAQPQTEEQFIVYYYNLIGQHLDGNANSFRQVMLAKYPWNGQMLQIPINVPLKGQQLPPDAPFYGLTQQASGGVPSGRLWLPAAVPQLDENGNIWYTRYIQYIKDKPGGIHGVDFLWSWTYMSGSEYVPLGGSAPVPPVNNIEQRLQTLEAQAADHERRLKDLEAKQAPKKLTLKADNGKYVTAEVTQNPPILSARGDDPDAWQQFEVEFFD